MAVATSQPSQSKNKSLLINGRIALIILASLGLNLLLVGALFWQIFNNSLLAARRQTLVQLQGGDTAIAATQDGDHREPEVVLETAKLWFEMTYAKSHLLPGGERDPGVQLLQSDSRKRVPTPTYRASYLLPSGYRTAFLEEFRSQYISTTYFRNGKESSIVRIWDAYVLPDGNPKDGWIVEIVATIIDLNGLQEVRETPVNLSIKLHPVIPNVAPYGDEDPVELRRAVAKLREAGIAITSIEPLDL